MSEGPIRRGWRWVTERGRQGAEMSAFESLTRHPVWHTLTLLLGPALGVLSYALVAGLPDDQLPLAGKVMLAILVHTATYWATGVIPPFATALMAMGLMVFLLGLPAQRGLAIGRNELVQISGWEQFVSPAAAPIIVLMLGGFVLSDAAHKHGIDRVLASALIRPFGNRPSMVLLGIMGVTALFSMWMSNTATAAMMITLVLPLLARLDKGSSLRGALVLAVPISCNIGGIGTPIGTPPNAIAFAAMRSAGLDVSFLGWMAFGVPVTAVMLLLAWLYLRLVFRWKERSIDLDWSEGRTRMDWRAWVVVCTMLLTIGLWVSSAWTGLSVGAVAIIPIVVFTATRLINRDDFNRLEWNILMLMAGGIALGGGIESTGLDRWLVGLLPLGGLGVLGVIAVLTAATILMSTFMSNTAVANLLTPLALGIAVGSDALGPAQAAVAVALGASLAMALPVSTPPNAIAFATGQIRSRDMLGSGAAIGAIGVLVVVVVVGFFL